MLKLFDYIFLRVYQYFKEKGDNVPDTKGSLILSLIQLFTILDVMVFVNLIYDYAIPSKLGFFLPLMFVIGFINWYRYEKDFDLSELENRWKDEGQGKRITRGWLIGTYVALSFLIPAVYGYLKFNLKAI